MKKRLDTQKKYKRRSPSGQTRKTLSRILRQSHQSRNRIDDN